MMIIARVFPVSLARHPSKQVFRGFLSLRPTPKRSTLFSPSRGRRWGLVLGTVLTTSAIALQTAVYADSVDNEEGPVERKPTPLSSLVRSYVVYTACSIPGMVDWSPTILSTLMSVPVVKRITEAVVRITFFDQFVGGESAEGTLPVLEDLRKENKGCILAYSVEVDESEAAGAAKKQEVPAYKRIVQEMIHSIDVAADFEEKHASASGVRGTWIAVKLTAMLPNAQSLINLSKHLVDTRPTVPSVVPFPGAPHLTDLDVLESPTIQGTLLTERDIIDLRNLYADLIKVCTRAQERGIRLLIDAEYSWYQPAIDAFTLALMRQFNKLPNDDTSPSSNFQPLIYATFQAYLRRTPAYVAQSLADARAGGYALGIKLVRDAAKKHSSLSICPDLDPPVWATKSETDHSYNSSVKVILDAVVKDMEQNRPSTRKVSWLSFLKKEQRVGPGSAPLTIGVLFGSHNWESQKLILEELVNRGLATVEGPTENGETIVRVGDEVAPRVTVAQLYGMKDALTNYIVDRTRSSSPFVVKYIPYGTLVEVMPYLSRRAIENKSVLGNGTAEEERRRALEEMKKRLLG
ncbi:unnamed protein product [Somion occarium]|uniref:Proline dehydrogenase n=1 Tax=Somion occarium TaxID=3059160 RepID=A0ABP1CQI7_9APHY